MRILIVVSTFVVPDVDCLISDTVVEQSLIELLLSCMPIYLRSVLSRLNRVSSL